ncbi:MAG: hypothetical protein JNM98_06165 [Rhodocyclaceae bacterium]|nr:hypothetical protein [Rhodocyclaceae bacterium]
MSPRQFAALARVKLGLPSDAALPALAPSVQAARLMLVDGLANNDAARLAGVTPQAAANARRKYLDAWHAIAAAGPWDGAG